MLQVFSVFIKFEIWCILNKRDNYWKWYETRRDDVKLSINVGPFDEVQLKMNNFEFFFQKENKSFCLLTIVSSKIIEARKFSTILLCAIL